jgi:hypothetical protein
MSNNSHSEADRSQEARSGNPSASSPAYLAAAAALMSLSRSGSSSTRVDTSQSWDARTTTQRLEPVASNATGGGNSVSLTQVDPSCSAAATPDQVSQLAERLMAISLVHSNPPQVRPLSEPSTFVTPGVQPTIQYYRSSEVPGEVGCFVDVWEARAYTPYTILNMLLLKNVIVPPEYVSRRVGLVHVASDSNLRSTYCGDRDFPAPQAQHVGEEEETEEDADGADRQSWESQFEFGITSAKECLLVHG